MRSVNRPHTNMKKKMLNICIAILSGFILFACKKSETKTNDQLQTIYLEEVPKKELKFQIQKVVKLETNSSNLLGDNLQVRIFEDYLYIYDVNARKGIHKFDLNGRHKGQVISIGEGPDNISGILDYLPTKSGLEILTGMGEQTKITYFDSVYKKENEIPINYIATSFEKLGNESYFFSGSYNLPFVNDRLVITNKNGEIINKYLENDYKNEMLPMTEKNFTKYKEKIYYHEVFNPIVYQVETDTILPRYKIDFGRYNLNKSFWETDLMENFDKLLTDGIASINNYWENDATANIEIIIDQAENTKKHLVIWDKITGEGKQLEMDLKESSIFYNLVGQYHDHYIFIAQAYYVANDIKFKDQNIKEEDNPVLLFAVIN